jgi:hypothetical protein
MKIKKGAKLKLCTFVILKLSNYFDKSDDFLPL